ncbi:hypothetical protein HK102_007020 [Quaeritorhiza haematococci]|nr:hypothetical protein HK102_007020 [Quaeritorhiza haematococci]
MNRRRLTIAPGTVLPNTTFYDKLLNFVSEERAERGAWPSLEQVPNTVTFRSHPTPYPTTRHHIMDIRVIRKIFNTLVFQKIAGEWRIMCPSFLDSLGELVDRGDLVPQNGALPVERFRSFLRLLNFHPTNMEDSIRRDLGPTAGPINEIFKLYDDLEQIASWIPFNIFIGPQGRFRADDPGDAFEVNAKCLSFFRCQDVMRGLIDDLHNFLTLANPEAGAYPTGLCRTLSEEIRRTGNVRPIRYIESDWTATTDGKLIIKPC